MSRTSRATKRHSRTCSRPAGAHHRAASDLFSCGHRPSQGEPLTGDEPHRFEGSAPLVSQSACSSSGHTTTGRGRVTFRFQPVKLTLYG
jgi:hypothetical protein